MPESHKIVELGSPAEIAFRQFLRKHRSEEQLGNLGDFERQLHGQLMAIERENMAQELARYDLNAERIQVGNQVYRRGQLSQESYGSASGPITVERYLYHAEGDSRTTICPLELRAGLIEGAWTQLAGEQMAFVVALLTAANAEKLLAKMGNMSPSRSSLERLPKKLSDHWEAHRCEWEQQVRAVEVPPVAVAVVALSLDGVMVPMKTQKASDAAPQKPGRRSKGPEGYREASAATISLFDAAGERLQTKRWSRMPEAKKVTLHQQLRDEYRHVQQALAHTIRVNLSDGAQENWRILRDICPDAIEIVDFYHACEYLSKGFNAYYGDGTDLAQRYAKHFRLQLRDMDDGAMQVIRAFRYRLKEAKGKKAKPIQEVLTFFLNHKEQMRYAEFRRQNLPIGSGVVEAACKTLVTQRLKGSGMRWLIPGGQAILTLRSLMQSDRWEQGWEILRTSYQIPIQIVASTRPAGIREERVA